MVLKPKILLGKAVKRAASLRGGGSALPGLIVEKIDSSFVSKSLAQLPEGVIVISGTNGKTTTTKMVVELLESQGLKVFTNRTGSNFTRGVAAALLGEVDLSGKLEADIAVLELDEAHAVRFVETVKPRFCLLLNVMRDQLDRFGEIDKTTDLLRRVAEATSEQVVINREDPRLLKLAGALPKARVSYFGLNPKLADLFPSDDELRSGPALKHGPKPPTIATLETVDGQTAQFILNDETLSATLKLEGVYNIYNAVAAVALVGVVLGGKLNTPALLARLETITPAFGRGEKLTVGGQPFELVLVKNPGGFRLGLTSFPPKGWQTMIAINDNYADGRDMSWLWDVEFGSLKPGGVACVSGIRAYDMALRLQYDEIDVGHVETNLTKALRAFIQRYPDDPKRVYCSYTAMLALRRELGHVTKVEHVS
jgi:UDP-N-acetylmuramyl tripeptide synthase